MRKLVVSSVSSLLAVLMIVTAVFAAFTFDPSTGTGFVGKGDVQLAFGWNNNVLQKNAGGVTFKAVSTEVSEVSWICSRVNPQGTEQTQERARTTTTEIQGVLASVAREKNQITGFNLTGYNGDPTETSTTEGPAIGSCPTGWTPSTPSDPTVLSSSSQLFVSFGGTDVELIAPVL